MPSALVATLAAPLHQLAAQVGPGWSAQHPSALLEHARDRLDELAAGTSRAWHDAEWSGDAGAAAARSTDQVAVAVHMLAERVGSLAERVGAAADAIAAARARLQDIIADFEAHAAELEPLLDDPGVAEELAAQARHAQRRATDVVDGLRAELDGHAATIEAAPRAAVPPAPAGLSGAAPAAFPGLPTGAGALGAGLAPALAGGLGGALERATPADRRRGAVVGDPAAFGSGVAVRLPDGSTATAPNAVAASAVRHALTQLGVPYDWGGTTPGVGLDCSGLTQWAYREAGLDIPRLAQEQDIGAAVDAGSLRPGDLAVWDGHVAMIVGNGTMIEAGDPVQLSPIRTTNAGQDFQGFWRPTA
ncbi:NLP/P60-family secreted protein [Mycolicibacterium canariasense]|uniref:NLP/P60-family secreted protein n=1 Tax=Mycolicibacterium canariasense TaxID=228230 RepID=A0A124E374_MYCCR|nr:C40 family peptidase [Mycolicibacterium canariasense]MCV7208163.1 C40 family peptidase [Mycolicibacterium canariasense]ORV09496.1 glycoside hydrolase [Mycolicibacterium canariasense]GAS99093.1 NLP/P60-family secreted protein [Mycolicibacterium canariasense]